MVQALHQAGPSDIHSVPGCTGPKPEKRARPGKSQKKFIVPNPSSPCARRSTLAFRPLTCVSCRGFTQTHPVSRCPCQPTEYASCFSLAPRFCSILKDRHYEPASTAAVASSPLPHPLPNETRSSTRGWRSGGRIRTRRLAALFMLVLPQAEEEVRQDRPVRQLPPGRHGMRLCAQEALDETVFRRGSTRARPVSRGRRPAAQGQVGVADGVTRGRRRRLKPGTHGIPGPAACRT